jgi:hypothetical protein
MITTSEGMIILNIQGHCAIKEVIVSTVARWNENAHEMKPQLGNKDQTFNFQFVSTNVDFSFLDFICKSLPFTCKNSFLEPAFDL